MQNGWIVGKQNSVRDVIISFYHELFEKSDTPDIIKNKSDIIKIYLQNNSNIFYLVEFLFYIFVFQRNFALNIPTINILNVRDFFLRHHNYNNTIKSCLILNIFFQIFIEISFKLLR